MQNDNRLFVYGIFLSEYQRERYGMSNPVYTTVPGYITIGGYIVQAVAVRNKDIALTGLVVDVDPSQWNKIDSLERGYQRVKVETIDGESVWMYASPKPERNEEDE